MHSKDFHSQNSTVEIWLRLRPYGHNYRNNCLWNWAQILWFCSLLWQLFNVNTDMPFSKIKDVRMSISILVDSPFKEKEIIYLLNIIDVKKQALLNYLFDKLWFCFYLAIFYLVMRRISAPPCLLWGYVGQQVCQSL